MQKGFKVNFLGVKVRDSFLSWDPRLPLGDWHSGNPVAVTSFPPIYDGFLEWLDLLESVVNAKERFVMMELGAGFGNWLVNAAAALRQIHGPPYFLVGVEAEPTHFAWMKLHTKENGIDPAHCKLLNAAVWDKDGFIDFYVGKADRWYGQSIVYEGYPRPPPRINSFLKLFSKQAQQKDWKFDLHSGLKPFRPRVKKVRSITLASLLSQYGRVDLIDLDVQGAELAVLQPVANELDKKVRMIHVGTHSREIEAGLRVLFNGLGWENRFDYQTSSESLTPWGLIKFIDGVQTWTNPHL